MQAEAPILERGLWPGQLRLLQDHRHGVEHAVVAGNYYGKTFFGANWFFNRLMLNRNSRWSIITAPKEDLLWKGPIEALRQKLYDAGFSDKPPFKDFRIVGKPPDIEFAWRHTTICRSLNEQAARTLVAISASHGWMDEPGLCEKIGYIEVAKRIRCPKAKVRQRLYTGTPEGVNEFSDRFAGLELMGERHSGSARKLVLHGRTTDNPYATKDYIQALYDEFGWNENLIKAYIFGQFVPLYDHQGYDFDRDRQVRPCPVDPRKPLILGFDFNVTQGRVGGVSWAALQEDYRDLHVVAENREGSRTTDIAIRNFCEQFPPHENGDVEIHLYGDPAGYYRDTRGQTNDWDIVEYELRQAGFRNVANKVPRAHPSISLRIACVNRLCSDKYHSALYIDPKCTKTIKSLELTTIDEKGKIKKPPGETHTHYADAIGYPVVQLRPIVRPQGGQYTSYVEG